MLLMEWSLILRMRRQQLRYWVHCRVGNWIRRMLRGLMMKMVGGLISYSKLEIHLNALLLEPGRIGRETMYSNSVIWLNSLRLMARDIFNWEHN